jgi:hypothetical protein
LKLQINSVDLVHERTIPTERPPFVSLLLRIEVSRDQHNGFLLPYTRIPRPEPLLLLPSSSSVVLARLSGPSSRPTTSQKIW